MAAPSRSDVLFHLGGRALLRYGTAWRRRYQKEDAPTIGRASGGTAVGRDGLVHSFAHREPRIEWVDLDGDGIRETPGLLLEEARTNVCLRSEELDNAAWTADNTTVTANATTAADGLVTMDKLVETAVASLHQRFQAFTITDSEYVSISCFMKAAERTKLRFIFVDGATGNFFGAQPDLVAGTVGGTVSGTGTLSGATIEPLANSIFRVRSSGRLATGVTAARVYCGLRDAGGVTNYTGDGTSGAHYWGVQVERHGVGGPRGASSYMRTGGASATRAVDTFSAVARFAPADMTILYRLYRPPWGDFSGSLGGTQIQGRIGGPSTPNLEWGSRDAFREFFGRVNSGSIASATFPAGNDLRMIAQFRNFATQPQVAVDVGSGLTSFVNTGTAITGWAAQLVDLNPSGIPVVVLEALGVRGLFSRADMLAY